MNKGIKMEDEPNFEPNYPKGYRYKPWSIDEIMADMRAGKTVDQEDGNWD